MYSPHLRRSSNPRFLDRCLLLTTERCVIYSSSVGSSRSQYITISSSFTDVFLPSSLHSNTRRLSLRRLCYRRCLIAETFLAAVITAASQCLPKSKMLSSRFAMQLCAILFQCSPNHILTVKLNFHRLIVIQINHAHKSIHTFFCQPADVRFLAGLLCQSADFFIQAHQF